MAFQISALPPGLRHTLFTRPAFASTRRASLWTRSGAKFPSQYFTRTAAPSPFAGRKLLWLLPVAGGLVLYASPQPRSLLPTVFASPSLIPCSASPPPPPASAPVDDDDVPKSIVTRVIDFLRDTIWEPILTTRRIIHLLWLFVPVMLSAPMLLIGKPDAKLQGDRWGAVWWYGYLTNQMQRAGPTFVKLAQWAASRADLFPALLCERLGALHSRGMPHSFAHTKRVIERVFQRPFDEVFEEFDHTPIGTGAIAQVYRATLKHDLIPPSHLTPKRTRRKTAAVIPPALIQEPPPSVPSCAVAIKILHPRVNKLIERDLRIMSFFAHIISLFPGMQWLSLPEEVEVFGRMMYEQLDLRREADNLITFEKNFANRRLPVTFPRPLRNWTTKDILVEEYQNALPLEWFLKHGGGPYNDQLAEVGLDTFLNMLLLDNFVHSDLHPGNIMIKFVKPAQTLTIKGAIESIFGHSSSEERTSQPHTAAADALNDAVVSHLRELHYDPPAWRAELESLHEQGYMPEIVFIDAGLVTTLDGANRKNFLDLFRAVAEFDGYHAGMLMVERCRTPELAVDPETFALRMQHIVLNVKRKTFSLGQIKISDILTEVLRAVRQHHVKMEADFVNTVIAILLLEGIGRQLDPDLDLFKSALPILRQLGRQMSTQETMAQVPSGNIGAFLKVWVWLEARELASAAFVNADDLVKYDWLCPSV
ncbi:ABC1-domain-containing protein [Obba rivulosa]|uniref:ABC1-domain-containing protein n=1 Tax=Obba rivulosa TaxID=1052685 RepID=A0A8E2AMK0_9APHY|nr:ABC1-domain-containing protein [Obba rivulosa]